MTLTVLPPPIRVPLTGTIYKRAYADGHNDLLKKIRVLQEDENAEMLQMLELANNDPEKAALLMDFKRRYLDLSKKKVNKKKAPK